MAKLLKRLRIFAWCVFVVGFLGAIAILFCCLFLGRDGNKGDIYLFSLLALECALSFGSMIVVFSFSFKIEHARHLADLKATDVVGNDIGAAYDFGQIGLIITDDKGNILWMNNLLLSRGINLVDSSINDLSPKLYEMIVDKKNTADSASFRYNRRFYSAKFIRDADLFILKDDTTYQDLLEFDEAHTPVIGYLSIDNYSDIPSMDEQDRTQTEGSISRIIFNYFNKYNCFIKSIRVDYYIIVMNRCDLEAMENEKFSVLKEFSSTFSDSANGHTKGQYGFGLTISLGFGFGYKSDFIQTNNLAKQALDVAMTRGGNQSVVAPFGENMIVFGGAAIESQQAASAVKIKTYARSFLIALERASNILIVPHINSDMDAIGACLAAYAITQSLQIKKKVRANIVYSDQNVDRSVDHAIRAILPDKNPNFFQDVFVSFAQADDLNGPDTLILVVDHNTPSQSIYPALYSGNEGCNIAVIDHHRKQSTSFQNTVFEHIDSSSSSTCELLALYIDSFPFSVKVPDYIATLMLSGIYLDTQNFKAKTRVSTYEAAIILARLKADEKAAIDFLKEDFDSFVIKSKILANLSSYSHGVLLAKAPGDIFVSSPLLAMSANDLTCVEDVDAAFCLGYTAEKTVYISARGNGRVNCEMLMLKMHGGGHFSQAATALENTTLEEAESQLRHILDQYLLDATAPKSDEENDEEEEKKEGN